MMTATTDEYLRFCQFRLQSGTDRSVSVAPPSLPGWLAESGVKPTKKHGVLIDGRDSADLGCKSELAKVTVLHRCALL